MRWPLDSFIITQGFHGINKDFGYEHWGTDLAANEGVEIKAPESGVITAVNSGWKPGGYFGGNYVKLSGDSGHSYYMGHMSAVLVNGGNRVSEGQVIGKVGSTGQATGPHVHFEMYKGGVAVNAENIIKGKTMVKVNIDVARCMAYWAGRDGRDGRANARKGETDADLVKIHVGQDLTWDYIFGWMNSGEMTANIKRLDAVYAERDSLRKQVADLKAQLAVKPAPTTDAEQKLQTIKDTARNLFAELGIK
jgi:murein DD-endopeptidase MepM/ murein hydrolase activator NlpD